MVYRWACTFIGLNEHMNYTLKNFVRSTCHVAVSCGYSTCFAVSACDGLCHLTKIIDRVETPFGFQPIVLTFVRHTVGRCLIFPALLEVARVTWSNWTNHRHC